MNFSKITFQELPINQTYGKQVNRIFYVIENNRSKVIENFQRLQTNEKDLIKD